MGEKTMEEAIRKNWTPHPGEFIREEIEARGWSQRDLAYILGSSEQALNTILSGKRGISPEMAKAMGNAFDVPAELFLNLQKSYELAQAHDPDPGIAKRAKIQSKYPVREMIRRGWLEDTDASMLEEQIARFFNVARIDEVPHLAHAAKKTNYDDTSPEQLAWLFRVKQIAKNLEVPPYSEKLFRDGINQLKQLLVDPEEIRHLPRLMIECGVRFIIVEALPGSKIDGACFWLGESPVIGMSLRLDRIDNFWFVARHEGEHVLKRHGRDREIIDTETMETQDGTVVEEERIANAAAVEFCVPKKHLDDFIARKNPFFYEKDVIGLARLLRCHPGLVVGQIRYRTKRWDYLTKYLVKVRSILIRSSIVDGWGHQFPVSL
jgi:HTH-type transcriptional regulator/antitoxin HigA